MHRRIIIILLSIFIFRAAVYAEIKIYLQPKIAGNTDLKLKDISLIEGSYIDIEKIRNINIENRIYNDGYIDKKEISALVKQYSDDSLFIYGDAVRIIQNQPVIETNKSVKIFIKKGDSVDVVISGKGVTLFLRGIVLNEGKFDDEVSVKLESRSGSMLKTVKGKVKDRDRVEVSL